MAVTTNPKKITAKQPAEDLDYNFDWTPLLTDPDINDTIVASNTKGDTTVTVDDDTLLLGDLVIGTLIVKQWVSEGTVGKTYKLTCFIATQGERYLEAELFIPVKEI